MFVYGEIWAVIERGLPKGVAGLINELKEKVRDLSENEAKSLLFLILLRIEMAEETKSLDEQLRKDLREIYSDFMKNNAGHSNSESAKVRLLFILCLANRLSTC
ncbi:hypothetical protein DRW41_08840 [Neobacillus piezotolerans]|uniref:Uncharacterized protein n=1 Tax=Neobacillus piezotolerans TaxID=2259171 RepID=A0A3D8GU37_9BACI|nr:hypothetical protein [Neobacillus piezotolerans]RDU37907.1 hypothetical protein DRW41_08840 [Neobacillus piezotolerans]